MRASTQGFFFCPDRNATPRSRPSRKGSKSITATPIRCTCSRAPAPPILDRVENGVGKLSRHRQRLSATMPAVLSMPYSALLQEALRLSPMCSARCMLASSKATALRSGSH